METRTIGSFEVSVGGLGCNNFGMRIGREETAAVVHAALDAGIARESVDLSLEPTQLVPVPDEGEAKKVLRLLEAIDDHDDVQAVHSNADIPDEVLAAFEG